MQPAKYVYISVEAVVAPACFWLLLSADIMSGEENGTLKSGSEGGQGVKRGRAQAVRAESGDTWSLRGHADRSEASSCCQYL